MSYTNDFISLIHEWPHYIEHIINQHASNVLKPLHSYWIRYIWNNDNEDRCLQAARDQFKTTAVMFYGSIWWLLFHPNDRIALIKKKYNDAAAIVTAIRNAMLLPRVRELFKYVHGEYPTFKTKREGKLEFSFKKTITPEGSINALGIDTTVTGSHFDKILCDDFVNLDDRISAAKRDKTKYIIRELRTNVIGQDRYCGFIGTPWHKEDAWSILPDALMFDIYDCNILNEKQIEEKKAKTTLPLFAINYLLKHIPDDGLLFSNPQYGIWGYNAGNVYGHIDAAFDGIHTCGLTFMSENKYTGKLQGYGKIYTGNVKNWLDVIEVNYKKRRCKRIYIENNADKGYTESLLKSRGINVTGYHESMNKHHKICTYLHDQWKNIIWDNDTDPEYIEQITDYMKDQEPDDCPDSAASLIREKFASVKGDKSKDILYRLN